MRERLLEFLARLRHAGIRISVAEAMDAADAVAAAGWERACFREALAATLIKDESDREAFDLQFENFYRGASVEERESTRRPSDTPTSGTGRDGDALSNPIPRREHARQQDRRGPHLSQVK